LTESGGEESTHPLKEKKGRKGEKREKEKERRWC
jgi:hypothetical protein